MLPYLGKEKGAYLATSVTDAMANPHLLPQALVIESVDLRDLPGFVISSDQSDAVGIADLEGDSKVQPDQRLERVHERAHLERQQQQERLHAVESSVDEVAHEEIVGVGNVAADLEQLL